LLFVIPTFEPLNDGIRLRAGIRSHACVDVVVVNSALIDGYRVEAEQCMGPARKDPR
jgi:hypothetical protein